MIEYRNDTAAVKKRMNYNNYYKYRRRGKSKRRIFHKSILLFLMLCCFIALAVSAIRFIASYSPFDIDIPFEKRLFTGTAQSAEEFTQEFPMRNGDITKLKSSVDANNDFSSKEQTTVEEDEWSLVLVNKWNYMPENYGMELTKLSNGQSVDKRIYPALQEMFDAARSDNVYPAVVSGYRTAEEQRQLLGDKTAQYRSEGYSAEEAAAKAETWVAVPGTSEHQLGIAVDVNPDAGRSAAGEVYEWLEQNSYKFGFILRYPADKTEITGIADEPWHYRYVGQRAASEIYERGICLEEYLDKARN